jgi:arylformamidase
MTATYLDRRAVMAGAAALATAGPAFAQSAAPANEKGPRIWLDMDQTELDDAYNQIKYAPNLPQLLKRYASNSEAARTRLGTPKRVAYGSTSIEMLDIYTTKRANAPISIFIHGGAWRAGAAKDYAFPAELFVRGGAHYVVLDFVNVLETKGDLMPMADQVRRAIAWVHSNAASFNGDAGRIYICGHSSGAHLGGVALITDWSQYGAPADVVKGALLCSGMYDLKPVRLSARSKYVAFTEAAEDALSTQRHLDKIKTPLIVAHGTNETPEFQRQTRDFAAALKSAGKPVEFLIGQNYNHFEMPETLANPYGLLGRAALAQMKLAAA